MRLTRSRSNVEGRPDDAWTSATATITRGSTTSSEDGWGDDTDAARPRRSPSHTDGEECLEPGPTGVSDDGSPGADGVLVSDGGQWGQPQLLTQTQCQYHEGVQLPSVISLSCASASFCRAVESSTAEWNYDGAGWRPVTAGPGTFTADAVACPSASQCEGFDGNGLEAEDDGSGFGDLQLIGASDVDVSVSCASEGFCAAVDSAGDLVSGAAAGPLVTLTVRIDEDVDGRGDVTFAGPMAACRTSSYTPCTRAWRPGTAVQRLCPGDQPGAR